MLGWRLPLRDDRDRRSTTDGLLRNRAPQSDHLSKPTRSNKQAPNPHHSDFPPRFESFFVIENAFSPGRDVQFAVFPSTPFAFFLCLTSGLLFDCRRVAFFVELRLSRPVANSSYATELRGQCLPAEPPPGHFRPSVAPARCCAKQLSVLHHSSPRDRSVLSAWSLQSRSHFSTAAC